MIAQVKPTVFYVESDRGLLQKVDVTLRFEADGCRSGRISACWSGQTESVAWRASEEDGERIVEMFLPDIAEGTEVIFKMDSDEMTNGNEAEMQLKWQPSRRWEVHFVPITHHDLGYTDTIEQLHVQYCDYYDQIVQYCEETQDFPEESRYRYTVEQTWSLVHYLSVRPPEAAKKFMALAGEGRIEVSATFGNLIDALCGHEQLHRLLYPSFRLKREYGIPVTTASMVDIPGFSWGLASVLANAGIRYLFAGLPTYYEWQGRKDIHSFWDEDKILRRGRPDAFRWEGPDGASVLTYYCGGYGTFPGGLSSSVTSPGSFDEVMNDLPRNLEELERSGSPFSVVRYNDHGEDNYPPQKTISYIVKEWNSRYAYPKLVVSTNSRFFARLETQCGDVRVFRGELPHTDYTVGATSAAKETAINRLTHSVLQAGETLAALSTALTQAEYPAEQIRRAYQDMLLYDEHCFGMWHTIGKIQDWQWSSKSHYAYRAAALSQGALYRAASQMAHHIRREGNEDRIAVFNPLGFERDELVKLHNFPLEDSRFDLIDERTGQPLAWQIVKLDRPDLPRPYASGRFAIGSIGRTKRGSQHYFLQTLVFRASALPPMGYASFRIRPVPGRETNDIAASGASAARPVSAATECPSVLSSAGTARLENEYYRVEVDVESGRIRSLFDKESSRELADSEAPFGMNQIVVRQAASDAKTVPFRATVERGEDGPVCASLRMFGEAAGCPRISQEIVLYRGVKKIEFHSRILKDATPGQEVYIAFPFLMNRPSFRFEGVNSVIRPLIDQLPGSNTNYYTVQHWAEASDEQLQILLSPVDSHIVMFGGLWPNYVSHAHHGIEPPGYGRPFVTADELVKGHMYAMLLSGNYRTNFAPSQVSDTVFRFTVTSRPSTAPETAGRFGWSNAVPPVPVYVDGRDETGNGRLPPAFSYCSIEPGHVLLHTVKQAEDGKGTILRLIETEGKSAVAVIRPSVGRMRTVYETSNTEENIRLLTCGQGIISLPVKARAVVTIRIEWDSAAANAAIDDFDRRLYANKAVFFH